MAEQGDTVSASKLQKLRNQIRDICDDELLMMALDSSLQLACAGECQPNCLTNAHAPEFDFGQLNASAGTCPV
ncbi:hypothetical protein pipiens_006323 [Culex pipiens pipiens]|uniref:Uncharacterized protein n=1 Tax=Culex pipiens pipiens TaxID=38569 RepID=A0ABD1DQ68_CULPP